MADFELGTDLPVTDLGISDGNSGAAAAAVTPGFTTDRQGNQYEDRSQRPAQAGGTASTPTDAQATTQTPPDTATAQPSAELLAMREQVAQANRIAQVYAQREAQREEAAFRTSLSQMQPEQARLAIRERQIEQAAQTVQAALAQHQAQQAAAEPLMKGIAVDMLTREYAQKTGLPADTLKGILSKQSSPQQMEAVAESLVALGRDAILQSRAQTGVDKAATAGSGTTRPGAAPSWRQQSLREQLSSALFS